MSWLVGVPGCWDEWACGHGRAIPILMCVLFPLVLPPL